MVCDTIRSSSRSLRRLGVVVIRRDIDMDFLSPAVASCSGLEVLELWYAPFSLFSVTMLSRAVASLTKLKKFVLCHSPIQYTIQYSQMLCTSLSTCSMMEEFLVKLCSLSAMSLPVIAGHLKIWPSLITLDLRNNKLQDLTEDQAQLFIDAVNVNGHIQTIVLRGCSVPSCSPVLEASSYTHHVEIV